MPGAGSVAQPIAEAGVANDLSRNAQRGQADLPVPLEALPSGALPPLRAVFPEGKVRDRRLRSATRQENLPASGTVGGTRSSP